MVTRSTVGGLKMMMLVLSLVLFLSLVGTAKTTNTISVTVTNKHEEDEELHQSNGRRQKQLIYDPLLNSNYMMSKRKVPNGPDPIHNRKAGNSKRPPGRF